MAAQAVRLRVRTRPITVGRREEEKGARSRAQQWDWGQSESDSRSIIVQSNGLYVFTLERGKEGRHATQAGCSDSSVEARSISNDSIHC